VSRRRLLLLAPAIDLQKVTSSLPTDKVPLVQEAQPPRGNQGTHPLKCVSPASVRGSRLYQNDPFQIHKSRRMKSD
jgi:hypothetical protein